MAFKLNATSDFGIEIKGAIFRAENPRIFNKTKMIFNVRGYADVSKSHFSDKEYECEFDISGENPYAQAYAFLKGLPEFSGAKDC